MFTGGDPYQSRRTVLAGGLVVNEGGDRFGGRTLHARKYVAVRVERDRDCRVSESLADDLRMDACPQGVCGVGVPQVVKPNPAHAGEPDSPLEVVAEQRRVDRISAFGGEDETVVVERRRSGRRGRTTSSEKFSGLPVEGDQASTALRLGRGDPCFVRDFDDCLHDVEFAGRLIDVAPTESEELTPTKSCGRRQMDCDVVRIMFGRLKEAC